MAAPTPVLREDGKSIRQGLEPLQRVIHEQGVRPRQIKPPTTTRKSDIPRNQQHSTVAPSGFTLRLRRPRRCLALCVGAVEDVHVQEPRLGFSVGKAFWGAFGGVWGCKGAFGGAGARVLTMSNPPEEPKVQGHEPRSYCKSVKVMKNQNLSAVDGTSSILKSVNHQF